MEPGQSGTRFRKLGAGVQILSPALQSFRDFLVVDKQLAALTVDTHARHIRRFLKCVGEKARALSKDELRGYLNACMASLGPLKPLRDFSLVYLYAFCCGFSHIPQPPTARNYLTLDVKCVVLH